MDYKERIERLNFYMKSGDLPLLIDFLPPEFFDNSVVIDSNILEKDLFGTFDGDFHEPSWSLKLNELDARPKFLIIKDITKCPLEEQKKFIPFIKDKEYSEFAGVKDSIILFLDSNYKKELVDKELLSYLVII